MIDNPLLLFAIILALPMAIRYVVKYVKFRTKVQAIKKRNVVVTQYESPPAIPPAFFGVLVDNRASLQDMFATILQLHLKGVINVKYDHERRDYSVQVSKTLPGLTRHENLLMTTLSNQSNATIWAKDLAPRAVGLNGMFNFELLIDLQKTGYYHFHKNLEKMGAQKYYIALIRRSILKGLTKPWNWPALLLCLFFPTFAIIWLVFSVWYYNRLGLFNYRTGKWEEIWPTVAGYYNYLQVVEAERRFQELENHKTDFKISQHDPYLVAAQLQPQWGKVFSVGKEIGAGGSEYHTIR